MDENEGKRWRKESGKTAIDSDIKIKREAKEMKKNKKIGRRWEKGGISRGQPGLICGNKAFLVAVHTLH